MPNITLEGISNLLKEELKPINEKLAEHSTILNQHTNQLHAIAKDVKNLLDEKTVTVARFDRVEKAVKDLAIKAGLRLDW